MHNDSPSKMRICMVKLCVITAFLTCFVFVIYNRIGYATSGNRKSAADQIDRISTYNSSLSNWIKYTTTEIDLFPVPTIKLNNETGQYLKTILNEIGQLEPLQNLSGSWLRHIVHSIAAKRKVPIDSTQYLYPKIVNIPKIVRAVRAGEFFNEKPLNQCKLVVLAEPSNVCRQPNAVNVTDLVIFVKTCATCFTNRMRIRQTYGQKKLWHPFKMELAFVLGIPEMKPPDFYKIGGVSLPAYSPEGASKLSKAEYDRNLSRELAQYHDLLIGDFIDTYYNLTIKTTFSLRWASLFCRKQSLLYLFVDDDQAVIPHNMIRIIRTIPPNNIDSFAGGYRRDIPVYTKSSPNNRRFNVLEDEIPWSVYPPTLQGLGYLLGAEIVRNVTIAMAFTKPFHLEDLYLAFNFCKLGTKLHHIPEFDIYSLTMNVYAEHGILPAKFAQAVFDWTVGKFKKRYWLL